MTSLLGNLSEGLAFIVSAPAGTGKTTLVQMLVEEFPSVIASISYTTRLPRTGEVPGKHYHFISESEFEAKIAAADFLEYVKLYGTYYGTSRQWIQEQQRQGKHVVLVIDTQGALQLKGNFPGVFIFIRPPSLEVLRERLEGRKTETPELIEKRLGWAQAELNAVQYYDYQIVNDELATAYQVLRSIVIAECHRVSAKEAEA
ncbi:guanylate kinase [Candidatus Protochlamydia phocaeensis]|uniref:guanylate kinase n=1 Tax=Candidatus Protochlamydia phocaeensis TaxID=1414722 RepID=UPI00083813B9|nr:guanylate kinase [Candidatus Protochlamydia phocaeensis]